MNHAAERPIVLAIGAHPDDIEFQCAGTLALLKQAGWRVVLATMTPGDLGSATLPREEIAPIRREEARRSASMLAAEYYCLESADFTIVFADELCRRATGLIRATRPKLVFTHPPQDYMADHEETSRIVRQACFAAPARNYEVKSFPGGEAPTLGIPHLYYFDPIDLTDILGRPVDASTIVDISTSMPTKERMLAQHASQSEWLRRQHAVDQYLEQMRTWARQRGAQIGCAFGEGFRQHLGHAYPRDHLLQTALGCLVHAVS
jgi:LmbE family N-acetylglucosaminyl deacetylase